LNIFVLDLDPQRAATYHCDQHMKMALEAAQLISSAASVLSGKVLHVPGARGAVLTKPAQLPGLYKPTHYNHGCCRWLRESVENLDWTIELGRALVAEKAVRGVPGYLPCLDVFEAAKSYRSLFPAVPRTPWYLAINPVMYPDVVITADPVETYRDYYQKGKAVFTSKGVATWTVRGRPWWFRAIDPQLDGVSCTDSIAHVH